MFNKYMILTRDFSNLGDKRQPSGFKVKIRIPYYRGVTLSLIDSIDLSVDGEMFSPAQMTFSIGGRAYSFDELAKTTDAEWPFGEPATLTVTKPGGLATGMHTVQLGIAIRKSYIPHSDPENLFDFAQTTLVPFLTAREGATKRMTLV
jgi:Domain of unknown function (DUF6379)